jgi:RNA polymerase sigma factor for flagellar operon FliA
VLKGEKKMAKSVPKSRGSLKAKQAAKVDPKRAKLLQQRARALAKQLRQKELEAKRRQDELVSKYLPYATSIANRIAQSLSSSVDYDDLICNARLGLLEAAQRYDEREDVDFKTFAYYRIKGAIYDGLRKIGWIPRTLYAKLKFEEASNEYMQYMSASRSALVSDDDKENELVDTVNSLASIYVISLDAADDIDIEDEGQVNIEQQTAFHQIRVHMRDAINSLPDKEKQLVKMYYFQNRTLEEAGRRLNLSKSWTSRLHARALDLLLKRIRSMVAAKGLTSEEEIEAEGQKE